MAGWSYTSADALTNKRWAKLMLVQFMQNADILRLASKEEGAPIGILDDLQKHSGDQVTYGQSFLLSGPGVLDLAALTGSEEAPNTAGDSLFVHELAHATLLVGPISNQRVLFDQRKIGRGRLSDWYAARVDHSGANQLGSYTPQTDTRFTGLQADLAIGGGVANLTTPAATTRQIIIGGAYPTLQTDAANISGTTMAMQLPYWDLAQNYAKSLTAGIRPIKLGGRSFYLGLMHPSQVTDLRTNTSTAQWFDIQKAAMTGGDIGDNPIFWQALGQYRQILFHENARITNAVANAGTAVANTKRALFLGAQAAMLCFGRASGEDQKFVWLEEMRDYGRQLGIGVSAIWGLKKVQFTPPGSTALDFGVLAIDSYGVDLDAAGAATNAQ